MPRMIHPSISKSRKVNRYLNTNLGAQAAQAKYQHKLAQIQPLEEAADDLTAIAIQQWAELTGEQQAEASRILKQIVRTTDPKTGKSRFSWTPTVTKAEFFKG